MRTLSLIVVVIFFSALVVARAADPAGGSQSPQEMKKQVTVSQRYLLYLPADYGKEKDKKWPLMLFLHGSGERGTDINKVKMHGPPKLIEKGKSFPFIVVSPQCDPDKGWEPLNLNALLDDLQEKYSVDADRIYLTGLSMGGFGTWELATKSPNRFAAIAPICGGADNVRRVTRALKDMPIWVFHGEKDTTVPIEQSARLVEALKQAGSTTVDFTRYPEAGHDSWTETYNNPKLYDWFLSHKRSDRPAAATRQ